jgi:hypothetical protein
MKITRNDKTFAVEVDDDAQAELVEALLRAIAGGARLRIDDPPSPEWDAARVAAAVAGVHVGRPLSPDLFVRRIADPAVENAEIERPILG